MWAYQFATLQNVAEKNGWTKFVSMQNHYNLLYREEEREMIKYCKATGIALIPVIYHPLPETAGFVMANTLVVGSFSTWKVGSPPRERDLITASITQQPRISICRR